MSRRALLRMLFAAGIGCGPVAVSTASRDDAPAPLAPRPIVAASPPVRFVRATPPPDARRSLDACAYSSVRGTSCIDALLREPDELRLKYMLRVSEAHARLGTGAPITRSTQAEIVECCNRDGPCGADKRTGHADCPTMDDGYACLMAAELLRVEKQDAGMTHARACRCSWARARIPVPRGTLACDAPDRPVERRPAFDDVVAREIVACATCDPAMGPAACDSEIERLRGVDPDVARLIERVVVTRCQLP